MSLIKNTQVLIINHLCCLQIHLMLIQEWNVGISTDVSGKQLGSLSDALSCSLVLLVNNILESAFYQVVCYFIQLLNCNRKGPTFR